MKTTIYCKPTAKGVHSFYLMVAQKSSFFLVRRTGKLLKSIMAGEFVLTSQ